MNQESTEAVFDLALKTQHENTKRAILAIISTKVLISEHTNELQHNTIVELLRFYEQIGKLTLEETK